MSYEWIKSCANEYPVARVCEVLQVSESGVRRLRVRDRSEPARGRWDLHRRDPGTTKEGLSTE